MQQTAPSFFNSLKKKVTNAASNVASGLMPSTSTAPAPMAGGRRRKSRRATRKQRKQRKQRKSRRAASRKARRASRKQRKSRRSSRK